MPQHSVAIHLSQHAAHLAVWESTLRKAELVSVHHVAFAEGTLRGEIWRRIRAELPREIASVVATVDAATTSTRLLSFPFGDPRKVEAALEFELESQVPFNLEDMAVTSFVVDRPAGSTRLLAAVTPKDSLRGRLAELRLADLEPRAVVMPASALAELVEADPDAPVAVMALGGSVSHLAVVARGLKYARTLRAGGDDVDRVLAERFDVDLHMARVAKEEEARLVDPRQSVPERVREISDAVAEGLLPLISSLSATFKTLPPEHVPSRMLITGGLSRLPGLAELLSQRLGIEVELLDLQESLRDVSSRVASIGPEYAVTLAMALLVHRRGRGVPLNFRRGELAYEGDIQVYRGQFTHMAIGLAAVLLLAIAGSTVRYVLVSGEEQRIDQAFCDATKKIVGRPICDPTAALATMRATPGASDGVVIPPYSTATLFEMVSKALAPDVDVTFDELDLRLEVQADGPDRIAGKGEAASFETTEQVVASLKRDPCVQEATVSKQRKARNDGRVEFSLTVKVTCPPGLIPGSKLPLAEAATDGSTGAASQVAGDEASGDELAGAEDPGQ